MKLKYKKFVDNGNGDCIYCNERRHDCCCDEKTAKALGYHYDWMTITKKMEVPAMPEGLDNFEKLKFALDNPPFREERIGFWRKGKKRFKNGYDLVDYHNNIET